MRIPPPVAGRLAWRYLRGRGLRTGLTTLAVALGVMLVFGLNGIIPPLVNAFNRSMLAGSGRVELTVSSAFDQPFEMGVLDTIARTPGVQTATPEVQRLAPLPVDNDVPAAERVTQLTVVGIEPATGSKVLDLPVSAGRTLTTADDRAVLLASDLAGRLGLGLGDELVLPSAVGSVRYRVVGLLGTPTAPGQERAYVPLAAAQRMFQLGDRITVVEATLTPDADRAVVEASVRRSLGADYTVGGLASNSSLLASLQMSVFAFNLFGVFAMATAGFIILNSFRTVVAERRRDIGMLRAIGTPRRTILGMFLVESLLQGLLGTALGLLAGWAMAVGLFAAMGPLWETVAHLRIGDPEFTPATWALAILLGVGVTVASALVPARAASRISPMEALRPQVGEVLQRRVGRWAWVGVGALVVSVFLLATRQPSLVGLGAVVFLVAVALLAPAIVSPLADALGKVLEVLFAREGAIARSNLQRNPGRSGLTVTTVMMGLASIVAMITVVQSVFVGFMDYIDKSLSADYLLIPASIVLEQGNVGAGPRLREEVARTEGIGAVSTLRIARGRVDGADVQAIGIDPRTYRQVADLEWTAGSSEAAYDQLGSGRWLIANGIFAGQLGLRPGETVELDTPNGTRTYHVAGVGNDYLNAKLATVYLSQDALARDFNTTTDTLIMANRTPGADPGQVRTRLDDVVADYPAFKLYSAAQWRDEQQNTFDQTYGIFIALIAALAVPSLLALVNTLAISVLSRTREIGMLRAVGATQRQVKRMVVAESLLLSLIGTLFGVVAGLWLGYALVVAMRAVGWPMPWTFPWAGVLLTFVVGLGFGVLAALAPARSTSRLDIVAALHHE